MSENDNYIRFGNGSLKMLSKRDAFDGVQTNVSVFRRFKSAAFENQQSIVQNLSKPLKIKTSYPRMTVYSDCLTELL